ncbi:MAG: guanylate kinase [Candidatus Methylacidiphilales bacterium]|nr:guanylate kinase [Candidatus Methylacidiphilales bacterium]
MNFTRQGILFVVSAPSGTGKSTLCSNLRKTPDFVFSVSCTTRPARPGETDGEDYHFISVAEFQQRIAGGEFLEHALVHGNHYGTLRSRVLEHLQAGRDVLLDIDIAGARQIRACDDPHIQASLADVFIMPPTLEELERRLRRRGTETEAQIQTRMGNARSEIEAWKEYRYTLLSESMEEDLAKFRAIMKAERYKSARLGLNRS